MPAGRMIAFPGRGPSSRFRRKKMTKKEKLNKKIKTAIQRGKEKQFKTVVHNNTITNTGTLTHLSPISQGDLPTERSGNVVFPYKMKVRLSAQFADSTNKLRIVIVKWRGTTAMTIANIFDVTSIVSPNQDYRPEWYHRKMGEVLYDTILNLSDDEHQQQIRVFNLKLKGKTAYTGATGTSYGENQYYLVALSNSAAAPDPNLVFETKILYTDA